MQTETSPIEVRKLTENEFHSLISSASYTETDNMLEALNRMGFSPYEFFEHKALENVGIVINKRPIYFASLVQNTLGQKELWTVVNNDVKEQFSLFKIAKRKVCEWVKKYHRIYATMPKDLVKNIRWTERIGFHRLFQEGDYITFLMKEGD